MKKLIGVIVFMMLAMMMLFGCSSDKTAGNAEKGKGGAQKDMSFGSATVGGFWYTLSGAMGEKMKTVFPDSSVTVVEGGSVSNILGLANGTFALGFSNGQTVPEALNGINAFKEKVTNVSTVATLYPNVFQIVVRADSNIHSIKDLKGKKVSPGIKGYSGELAFIDILEAEGMTYDDLSGIEYIGTADGADLLRDGHIDAIVGMVSAPVSTFQELDTTVGIRLIPLADSVVQKLNKKNEGYLPYTIKGSTYSKVKEDVNTVAGYTVLLVNNDLMDEDTVYKLTKMMFEEKDYWKKISPVMNDFDAEYSVKNNVGKLHPGAEKYYKEVGAIK